VNIQVTFIDWFGIAPINAQQPPFPTGATAPYSTQIRTVSRTIVDNKTYFAFSFPDIAYAPAHIQSQFLLQGWSPASMLAANAMVQNPDVCMNSFAKTDLPTSPEDSVAALALVWCLNFQDIGSPIVTPRIKVTYNNKSVLVESAKYAWQQALERLGNSTIVQANTSSLKSIINGKYTSTSVPDALKSVNLKSLENKLVPNYSSFDIATNWDFWGMGWDEHKPDDPWRLPVGSIKLKSTGNNVNFRDKPSKSGKVISILNKGDELLQTLPLDKTGWWGAVDSGSKYGFVSGEYVQMAPLFVPPAAPTTPSKKDDAQLVQEEKSNTTLYIGVGVGILVLGGAAIFLLRKK